MLSTSLQYLIGDLHFPVWDFFNTILSTVDAGLSMFHSLKGQSNCDLTAGLPSSYSTGSLCIRFPEFIMIQLLSIKILRVQDQVGIKFYQVPFNSLRRLLGNFSTVMLFSVLRDPVLRDYYVVTHKKLKEWSLATILL